jgi:hypothetical protein
MLATGSLSAKAGKLFTATCMTKLYQHCLLIVFLSFYITLHISTVSFIAASCWCLQRVTRRSVQCTSREIVLLVLSVAMIAVV